MCAFRPPDFTFYAHPMRLQPGAPGLEGIGRDRKREVQAALSIMGRDQPAMWMRWLVRGSLLEKQEHGRAYRIRRNALVMEHGSDLEDGFIETSGPIEIGHVDGGFDYGVQGGHGIGGKGHGVSSSAREDWLTSGRRNVCPCGVSACGSGRMPATPMLPAPRPRQSKPWCVDDAAAA